MIEEGRHELSYRPFHCRIVQVNGGASFSHQALTGKRRDPGCFASLPSLCAIPVVDVLAYAIALQSVTLLDLAF